MYEKPQSQVEGVPVASLSADFSIVIPARNEGRNLESLLPRLRALYPEAEILVVDDGSTDNTEELCRLSGVNCISHPYSKGNGAGIKTGARHATRDVLVFMDGDGQHRPEDIERLMEKFAMGYDMVVGARGGGSQASVARYLGNNFYNRVASWLTSHRIEDLTSGFRIVKAALFKKFLYLLPNGFSYPTTITMAFFRAGYSVGYLPIEAATRQGRSHINLIRDGVRFLIIIFKVGTLYSPLKIFVPFSAFFFLLGLGYYLYTYSMEGTFTNMSAVLFMTSIIVFLIGLVSEQITTLMYRDEGERQPRS